MIPNEFRDKKKKKTVTPFRVYVTNYGIICVTIPHSFTYFGNLGCLKTEYYSALISQLAL